MKTKWLKKLLVNTSSTNLKPVSCQMLHADFAPAFGLTEWTSIVRNIGGSSKISNSWWEYRSYLCWLSSILCDSYGLKIWKSHYLLIGGSDPNCRWYSSREKIWHDLENWDSQQSMFHSRQKTIMERNGLSYWSRLFFQFRQGSKLICSMVLHDSVYPTQRFSCSALFFKVEVLYSMHVAVEEQTRDFFVLLLYDRECGRASLDVSAKPKAYGDSPRRHLKH